MTYRLGSPNKNSVLPEEREPTCWQINRACLMYASGADAEAFRSAFPKMSSNALALLWAAAKTASTIDEKYPYPSTR